MRIKETKVYNYDELSDEAKENALNKLSDINVHDSYWYEHTIDDAASVYLQLVGFDIDQRSYCRLWFMKDAETAAKEIIKEHGESCETHELAKSYLEWLAEWEQRYNEDKFDAETQALIDEASKPETDAERIKEIGEEIYDKREREWYKLESELETEKCTEDEGFLSDLQDAYLSILKREYDYQTSKEAIEESIMANEYEFTEDGELA